MQDDEACGGGLQSGGELIGGDFAGEQGTNSGLQRLRRRRGRGGFGEHDYGNFRCEIGVRERFDDGFGRFAGRIDQEYICLRVGEFDAKAVDGGGTLDDFHALSLEAILQRGARERRSGDEEDANHAAAALLGMRCAPSWTVTQRKRS